MNLAGFALRNDKVIVFAVLAFALLGVRSYLTAPQSIFPAMSFARIDVVADVGELPPSQVRVAVARPLEGAFQSLPGVTNVLATSSQGAAELIVTFAAATDPHVDLSVVDQAIAQTRSAIPAARDVVAAIVDPDREPVLSYALTSRELSQAVLRSIALTQIVPKLYGTPGLGKLLITGGAQTEYHVRLDPAQLVAQGIGPADVSRALADANAVAAVGVTQRFYQRYAVLIDSSLRGAAALRALQIPTQNGAAVALGSLGTVALGVSPVTDQTSVDGRHAVLINVYGLAGADAVALARAFDTRLRGLVPQLPRDVTITPFWDQTTLIVDSQAALRDAIVLGAVLAIVVIYAFLRSLRLTLVAAAMIPLAMAIAIFALQLAGQTLNLMSVGGLAVAVGLIIDDAIVVIENIARNRRESPAPIAETIVLSMQQIGGAMIASTLTTVVVFLPLALLTGVTGFFFRALAFTLSAALIVSLGLALFIAPVIARAFMHGAPERAAASGAGGAFTLRYARLLRWALAHRAVVGIASAAVLAATVLVLLRLPGDFLPKMDEGQFEIAYTLPAGTTLAASDAAATQMERVVGTDPAVADVGRMTGIDSNGVSPTPPNQGLLRVRLKAASRRASYDDVSTRLRDRLGAAVPSALFDFHQILEDMINDLSGTPAPIEIALQGPDQQTLIALATRLSAAIGKLAGVVDTSSGVTFEGPSLRFAPRSDRLAALGLTAGDFGDAIAALEQGTIATNLAGAQTLIPVRVRVGSDVPGAALLDAQTPIFAKGATTAIGDLATIAPQRMASDILTQNGQLQVRVTANVANVPLSSVTAAIDRTLHGLALPPGYSAAIGGQAQSQARSFAEFVNVIAIAIALVFAVMLATFRSFRLPLVILTAIPLALIGVALGLAITGTAINVSSFMGLLLLVGVVVKNGILLIDAVNRRRAEGASVEAALVAAGTTRLRPIVMTTLAAIGGLLPLALGIGQGAEMEKPLAIAVIGGLSTATVFTLVVIPVLYAAFMGADDRAGRRAAPALALALIVLLPLTTVLPARAQPALPPASAALPIAPQPLAFAQLDLRAALAAAIAASPDVAGARSRLEQARDELAIARDGALPALVANYAQLPQGNPPGPNVVSRQVGAGVQWNIADFAGFGPAVRSAALAEAAATADAAAAGVAERVKTIGLYYDALRLRAIAAARGAALGLAQAQRTAADLRARAGDAPRLDVVRGDVAVARAQADLESARAADANATAALATETGLAVSAFDTTTAAPIAVLNPALTDPQRVAELAQTLRPEIASARLTAEAARVAVSAARASGLPALTIGAGYLAGTDSGVPVAAPTITANLLFPLGPVAHDRIALAAAKAVEAQTKAASIERQIVLDAAASARTLSAAERAGAASSRARQSAADELHATEIGYANRASSSLEVTAARATYEQAVVDELTAIYDIQKARATLDAQVGR